MSTGNREIDCLFSRVPLMEFDDYPTAGGTFSTGPLDLVDLIQARHNRVFDWTSTANQPTGNAVDFPVPDSPAGIGFNGVIPEPRFCVHYFIWGDDITRANAGSNYFEFLFQTCAFLPGEVVPAVIDVPAVRVPWVGAATNLFSLAQNALVDGEAQTGRFIISGRMLKVKATFAALAQPGNFQAGCYLSPILG